MNFCIKSPVGYCGFDEKTREYYPSLSAIGNIMLDVEFKRLHFFVMSLSVVLITGICSLNY